MDWTAKLLEPKLIQIRQDKKAVGTNDKVSYNLRCQKPLVDFDVTAVSRPEINVPLPYAGDYVVTRRIRNMTTGFTKTSATFANKDNAETIEFVGVEAPTGEQVKPKKTSRKRKETSQ
jgi:hypothetical protein